MDMAVTSYLSSDGNQVTINVTGQFNFSVYPQFREACRQAAAPQARYVIDLRGTDYMDSSALGMLLLLRERSGGDAADIRIANCNPEIRKIFEIANFDRLFQIC
jgi:anti-anti-sigma factor